MSFSYSLSIPKLPEHQVKRYSIHGITDESVYNVKPHQEIGHLSPSEKNYLLAVERGDIVSVNRVLMQNHAEERSGKSIYQRSVNINCVDPIGRSAILMAIDNENYEMLKLLINNNVDTKDALLYAVSEEFVEAVELLLDSEEKKRKPGEPHIWERKPHDTTIFTSDITPLVLAAHRDNYEIIKILLDKGAYLSVPHDSSCNCEECVIQSSNDSLLYSYSRINSYRALASPFLIVLSSKDPILTAFELSAVLRRLSKTEHEFKSDYNELRTKCQKFATDLLNHTRSSSELEILLNYNVEPDCRVDIKAMRLDRLKLAIKLRQKEFVAHPNVQQLLASIWYSGLPGFRSKDTFHQTLEVLKIGFFFPIFSIIYILVPRSLLGKMMRSPFIKFICHSASYVLFLFVMMISTMMPDNDDRQTVMYIFGAFILGLMWNEIKSVWRNGLEDYITDMWNIVDFITMSLYLCDIAIQLFLNFTETGKKASEDDRENYDLFHPVLMSEALFSTANIFSTLKIVHIFSINPYLGPLQIVLARVILDIAKFFLLYVLVLIAFSNGIHHLLSPYAMLQRKFCDTTSSDICKDTPYQKFSNLFETAQVLFWTAFGEIHLDFFSLHFIQDSTKIWGMIMYGTFCVICLVVLLNLLIAMMDHSYNQIFDDADVEWKYARSKLWISFFEEGGTAPVPFNVIPTPKSLWYLFHWIRRKLCPKLQEDESRSKSIQNVVKNLVQRYVIARQKRGSENNVVTEDDINEVKQEILSLRSDLIQILRESGMKEKQLNECSAVVSGKKNRFKERRLIKGLNMEFSESAFDSLELNEAELEKSLLEDDKRELKHPFSDIFQPILQGSSISIFKKKKKAKNILFKATSKVNSESNDEADDAKMPDSVQTNDESFDKKIWCTESSSSPNIPHVDVVDNASNIEIDIEYIDDSLEQHEQKKY